ncbi:hypothetical protein HK097_005259 [Rhizophlyctis rosea]|uniref:F-box domain-containing protein n=1 Tax=Rhizophlyctis rosea TaxID=64517 RepID=A0AAD5SF67_9FUNG|nr:hypothetical protein HK097_005259 [Rhizophlyctis rosea]
MSSETVIPRQVGARRGQRVGLALQSPDILTEIFSHFHYPFHLITLSEVSPLWHHIADTHLNWKHFALRMKRLEHPTPKLLSFHPTPPFYRITVVIIAAAQKCTKNPIEAKFFCAKYFQRMLRCMFMVKSTGITSVSISSRDLNSNPASTNTMAAKFANAVRTAIRRSLLHLVD